MATVHPLLARFAADLNEAYEAVCAKPEYDEFFKLFHPVSIELSTGDGVTAHFYEEGIEFYPAEKSRGE
jgi:hypothetical protein